MNKAISIAIGSSLGAAFIAFIISSTLGFIKYNLTESQLQTVAGNIVDNETYSRAIISRMKEDDNFKGAKGDQGIRGEAGPSAAAKAVIAFASQTCPVGWEEYAPAYGRFVRGIDKSGNRIDPDGERVAGNQQEDMFRRHSHSVESHNAKRDLAQKGSHLPANQQMGGTTGESGETETRPKNVALLYCIKS